jgi:uncharacterized protein YyaL (SSP411 family)
MTPNQMAAEIAPEISRHTNRLAQEKSPYLLQHAHNPVDWFPWGEAAFAKARKENKPIFLSIGYSTCHWCHVMAHESFENPETAKIMNREFVNIKVDREERPDVDRVYMTFVQATTGGGGWPMSVWLTPDLHPFVGGTYFPPEDRHGQPGFPKVLERIAATWKQDHSKIAEQGAKIIAALREGGSTSAEQGRALDPKILDAAYQQLSRGYDAHEGGFSSAPKFPRPATLNFLFRVYARNDGESSNGKHALEMNLHTLRKMAAGGIHDHLGGGFHRYSVDALWHVPHFEKMLYDQAQLAVAYLDAFQITHDPEFEKIARGILDYVRRDMTSKEGGFFSAEDADSLLEHGKPEHAEGAFYVWTKHAIDDSLGGNAAIFNFHYSVEEEGNAPPGSDPQEEFRGKNILIERHATTETAKRFGKSEDEIRASLKVARETLFALRAKRPRPHLDDKIITAWNGLMISAFARAARVLDESTYLESASRAAEFIRANLYDESQKTLVRNFRGGKGTVAGFAEDYAFVIQGLLDLYEAGFDVRWLKFAIELQQTQDRIFLDQKNGGYFNTSGEDKSVLLRMKEDNDGAEPSSNSVAALNLLRLAQLREAKEYRERGEKTIRAFGEILGRAPTALPQMLVAFDYSLGKPRQIVIAGEKDKADTKKFLSELRAHYLPGAMLILADQGEGQKYLGEKLEAIRAMKKINGKAAVYVCENFTCKAPVTDPIALRKLLLPEKRSKPSS